MRTLEEVRGRCRIEDGHWLWKGGVNTVNGRPVIYAPDFTNGGKMVTQPGPRAVYHLSTGRPIPAGHRVSGTCTELTCLNPAHMVCMTSAQWGERLATLGVHKGQTKRILANRKISRGRSKLTLALIAAIQSSDKMGIELAAELGLCATAISKARRGGYKSFAAANPFAGLAA